MNWHIGQNIVCIETGGDPDLILHDTYIVKGLRSSTCKCNIIEINVGNKMPKGFEMYCLTCNVASKDVDYCWYAEDQFRPLDEIADISELTEIINKPIEELFKV